MAIQISENKLSEEARRQLNNAKNKSQFLRDAIEFYVRREQNNQNQTASNEELKKELQEIKALIAGLTNLPVTYKQIENSEILATLEERDIKEIETVNIETVQNQTAIMAEARAEVESKELEKGKDDFSDSEKAEIEAMLKDSINILGF